MNYHLNRLFVQPILDRGNEYHTTGRVGDVYLDKDVYSAVVHGSKDYHVEIATKDGKISNMKCDCPYATNSNCKHMAALLYTMQKS